ncbi:MAG: aminotransferase class I/II-fold pyridoxal phosphate-dependent enzyme [Polyangiaceae bacterium]|nr:aminotransferase class I/II-fold pyridoxal phosphate-dependent enzyme [Polyangiaceae bacterium]
MPRIYLSSPHLGQDELKLVQEAFASNWIAPLGPHVDAFEAEVAAYLGVPHAAALSSGTAALHLALILLGVSRGDEVLCSTLTFAASANPIAYQGARPVFVDAERTTWNLDPDLVAEELEAASKRGRLPRAVIGVDLYGQSADWERLERICARYEVPIIEDAAEALGATYHGKRCGSFGRFSVLSFNGNKIITTSGGGMLLGTDGEAISRARFYATQARDPAPHYQHSVIGYNYRLSNVCAAIGRGQLRVLEERVSARRAVFERYHRGLSHLPGVELMSEAPAARSNRWLTCLTIDPERFGATREDVRLALAERQIEARPVWKPMHQQPVFDGCRALGGVVADDLFDRGLCLPSGSNLAPAEQDEVIAIVTAACMASR